MSKEVFQLRKVCRCGSNRGYIETRNGQDCVFCGSCNKHQYNAPKTETGRKPRTVLSDLEACHRDIKPKDRARILLRANGRCELCGRRVNLHVGHLVSVKAGLALGMTIEQLNSDENLCCLCDACNLGLGKEPVPLRLAVAMVLTRSGIQNHDDTAVERASGVDGPTSVGAVENDCPFGEGDEGSVFGERS